MLIMIDAEFILMHALSGIINRLHKVKFHRYKTFKESKKAEWAYDDFVLSIR